MRLVLCAGERAQHLRIVHHGSIAGTPLLPSDNFGRPRSDQPHSRSYVVPTVGLVSRVLDVSNVFDDVAVGTRQGLDDFLSATASWAMGACGPARTLGYYIPGERMHQVAEACQRTHGILYAPIGLFRCYIRED